MTQSFRLGLIVNPYAGIGGAEALKGSDDLNERARLIDQGVELRVTKRLATFFDVLLKSNVELEVHTWSGAMGAEYVPTERFQIFEHGHSHIDSTAEDTIKATRILAEQRVDLLVFVGGDGTARNIFDAVGDSIPVLGLPSGVKMHSGCYAVTPAAAAQVVIALSQAELVDLRLQEVKDIDEAGYRQGIVKSKYYGELSVPEIGQFVQATKVGGIEVEELVLEDISAEIDERFDPEALWIVGPGTTTRAFMEYKGLENTLLGVDVARDGEVILSDATATQLLQVLESWEGEVQALVTAIGGQGHVFGRGNQQFSPDVLKLIGRANFTIIMTKSKLTGLDHRPLIIDSNDPELDKAWSGFIEVVTGYHDQVLYPISNGID